MKLLGLQLMVMLYMAGFVGSNELELANWSMKVDEPNNDMMVHYKAEMNLQCSEWTCKATMNLQGNNSEMDKDKWTWKATYFQDKVNVNGNDTCEAAKNSQGVTVDNNGACKAATYLQEKNVDSCGIYEAWLNSWVRSYSRKVNMVENDLVEKYHVVEKNNKVEKNELVEKNDLVHKNDLVGKNNLVGKNDLVEKYGMVTKNDIMTEYDMVKLVHEKFTGLVSLAGMNRDGKKVLEKSFGEMAVLMVTPAVLFKFLFEIYSNLVNYLVKLDKAWQPLCLGVWWLLSPHRGYCLQWLLCLVEFAEGQVFQTIVVTVLLSCVVGFMAVSNMNPWRHVVARREHMSRAEKRRERRSNCVLKKQLVLVIFICSCSSAAAMEQDAMLQRIISLTEAATRAALSAEQTLGQVQSMTSSATSSSEGLQAASRILKAPDTFNGDDPMQFAAWRFQFTSWLTFGDRYTTLLEKVEAMTTSPAIASYDTAEKELAHKLYAVLTSYLRGRCSHIIKAFSKSRDGFAIWYQLMREFEPTSRQRSLALAQALASYPVFSKDKSCLESILVYEQTVQQFEEKSGTTYPGELKVATLMRCCNAKLREFLQLNIKDDATYAQVREHIMNYERVSKSWTQEQVLKAIQDPSKHEGPTPMEIDRVEKGYKGKGKEKGKSNKGGRGQYGGWEAGAWGFGRGRGRGKDGKGKGKKGRGRGNYKGKGKGKSKNGKGKNQQKGKVGPNQCSVCFGYGHWSRDCPHKPRPMEVNQVQEQPLQQPWTGYLSTPQHGPHPGQGAQHPGLPAQQLPVVSGATTASSSTFRPPSTSTGSTVRRIFHIGPPSPSSSPSSSTLRTDSIRMVKIEEVDENIENEYVNLAETVNDDSGEWVILDSGSDVSLLPLHFLADEGSDSQHSLRDCQGG